MLRFSKESSADILKGFECGVQAMDDFIHNSLEVFLKNDPKYEFHVAIEDDLGVVAMYITSAGIFVDQTDQYQNIPYGKPWAYMDDDLEMHSATMYPTLEIDYLAVRKDLREKGYGSLIIEELSKTAKERDYFFMTVGAYHTKDYSAIPFYQKQGFFALQEYSDDYDTLRMALRV